VRQRRHCARDDPVTAARRRSSGRSRRVRRMSGRPGQGGARRYMIRPQCGSSGGSCAVLAANLEMTCLGSSGDAGQPAGREHPNRPARLRAASAAGIPAFCQLRSRVDTLGVLTSPNAITRPDINLLPAMSLTAGDTPRPFQPPVTERDLETEVIHCVGGVASPLLANIYLHRVDRSWDVGRHGVLVRFADDLVVMCRSRGQAEAALLQLTAVLAGLSLEPKPAKTRIVQLRVGGEGLDFLGFHHRLVRSQGRRGKAGVVFLVRWPAKKAMQHVRRRVRELTARSRLLLPVDWVTEEVNRFLRGWAAYFRFGNSADQFDKINGYARMRLGWFITRRHRRSRGFGWFVPTMGATRLACSISPEPWPPPDPSGTGGKGRMPAERRR
jgi:Group II intron, maturase-specific domain/Reverse transcriptase (RNA-dependent DNA polymerase)